jgi:hypothetical protein
MKTPIEWLIDLLEFNDSLSTAFIESVIKQAKEIEKQQIELAFLTGKRNGIQICQYNSKAKEIKSEEYYNETFKNETT